MKKIIFIYLSLISVLGLGQSQLILSNNVFLNISDSAYLVIDNPNSNALDTTNGGGNIISEGEFNVVKWNISSETGTYAIPFTTKTSNTKIPQSTTITNAGSTEGSILFSTYETVNDNNRDYPSDVTNMNSLSAGGDGSAFAIDRFWRIDASSYSTKPDVSMSFGYDTSANEIGGTNTISESNLRAQQFNSMEDQWVNLEGTANIISKKVSPVIIEGTNLFQTWTLVDENTPLPINMLYFGAKRLNKEKVELNWSIFNNEKCKEILIERRFENELDFTTIDVVDCNQSSLMDYNNTSYLTYYRLRIVKEFSENRSKVRPVEGNLPITVARLFPNPTASVSNLMICKDYEILSFTIFDSRGRIVVQQNHESNLKSIQLDCMKDQPSGFYLINLQIDNENQQLRLIKTK